VSIEAGEVQTPQAAAVHKLLDYRTALAKTRSEKTGALWLHLPSKKPASLLFFYPNYFQGIFMNRMDVTEKIISTKVA
jgi:hypothetical protein